MTDGLLIELRQKTVQLLEAIDSGSDGAWDYGEIVGHHPEGPDQIVPPPGSAPSELESQGADAKSPAENLSRPADAAREIEAVAVAEALYGLADALALTHARQAIAALDRVRADSARGEDHEAQERRILEFDARVALPEAQERFRRAEARVAELEAEQSSSVDDSARGEDHRVTPEMVYEVAYGWCRKLGLPLMSPPRAPEAIDQLGREVERLRSARGEDRIMERVDQLIAARDELRTELAEARASLERAVDDTVRLRDILTFLRSTRRDFDGEWVARAVERDFLREFGGSVDAGKPEPGEGV